MKTQQYIDVDKSKIPNYKKGSKMKYYDLIYDENVIQNRVGFYKSKFINYEITSSDTLWRIEPQYVGRADLISFKFYNTARYDWVIEDANNIKDSIKELQQDKEIVIPNKSHVITIR